LQKAKGSHVRLHLLAEEQCIWLVNTTRATYSSAELKDTISLAEIATQNAEAITDRSKIVIAVILGHTLLHLYGTSWLREWNREKIVFIRNGDGVPLKPFLISQHRVAIEDDDQDAFFQLHQHPEILNLGIMLLELELKQSIESYLGSDYETSRNSSYFNAGKAFEKRQNSMYTNYRKAIESCLETHFGADPNNPDEDLEPEEFRRKIYLDIVKPLEDQLEGGFRDTIDVNDLDSAVAKLDVLKWGNAIVCQHTEPNRGRTADRTSADTHQHTEAIQGQLLDSGSTRALKPASHPKQSTIMNTRHLNVSELALTQICRSPSPITDMLRPRGVVSPAFGPPITYKNEF